ncbi:amino acid permease [Chitinophaga pendula]|uniref:amino acid permease n=1 Tax=Chitinophaga TaxID=79328 RepID=UPI000BAEAD6F|nr:MULTISPECIES: amino acid permease [Chitinophaga]ASZ13195.1 amino acid transporter [Chitinophaga sp. MD30]UCJ09185.1 amino acid permease [Chitinophaga pendula]
MSKSLFRKKSITNILQDTTQNGGDCHNFGNMHKVLKVKDLTFMGIAAVIGAGIFSTIGQAAYDGGPGVIFLFLITAVTCGFTALCYAEFASRVPVSGSAYTYSYVTFGELAAWIIGWALILEYAIGNIVVAISWSSYFNNVLDGMGVHLPGWLSTDYSTAKLAFETALTDGKDVSNLAWATAPLLGNTKLILNLPAFVIVVIITIVAYIGIQESKRSANFMVGLKIVVLAAVVAVGIFYINTDNWTPFLPNKFAGVLKGVSAVFFAYIGFDAISTTAEECANPQTDLPKGMLYSLIICTIIYIIVTLVITGMVHYSEFRNVSDPLAYVFEKVNMGKIGYAVSISAVVAATSVILVFQIGQPRIWMSMSRDGLLPKRFAKMHPRYKTPSFATIVTGFLVAIPSLFIESGIVTDLTSIGTLFAFVLVCGGVLLLPKLENKGTKKFNLPYINGRFIVPFLLFVFCYTFRERIYDSVFNLSHEAYQEILFLIFLILAFAITIVTIIRKLSLIPVLGMLCCLYLMIEIPAKSWLVFFGWMAVGLTVYFAYGYGHSKLGKPKTATT